MSVTYDGTKIIACRICLDTECFLRIPFDDGWAKLFEYCIGLPLTCNKNSPQQFCGNCITKLEDFERFKKLCIKSNALWKSMSIEVKCVTEKLSPAVKIKEEIDDKQYYDDYNYLEEVGHCEYQEEDAIETKNDFKQEFEYNAKDDTEYNNSDKHSKRKKRIQLEKKFSNYMNCTVKECDDGGLIKIWHCKKCRKSYKYQGVSLKHHIIKCYNIKGTYIPNKEENNKPLSTLFYCGICDFTTSDCLIVQDHFAQHCMNNDLNCKLCEYKGRDIADMATHRYNHHPTNVRHEIVCTACPQKFKVLLKLQFHYRSVHLKKEGGFCSVCNKVFGSYKSFRNHERLHKETKCFICDCCGKKFLFRNAIEAHLKEIHLKIKNFICHTCGKGFKRHSGLRLHSNTAHTDLQLPCNICKKIFKNEVTLQDHVKKTHGEKPYICNVCSKGYYHHCDLKAHMVCHNTERPFTCKVCNSSFKSKQTYKMHTKIHSGIKRFKCELCDRAFYENGPLKRHQSVHTGVRSIKCLYCDKTFHSKPIMVTHCLSRHKIEVKLEKNTTPSVNI